MIISLNTERNDEFKSEVNGNSFSSTAVIMLHGFGVKRDSRGMFTDIENKLIDEVLVVRPDLSNPSEKLTQVVPISKQVERLAAVVSYIINKHNITKYIFLGHSQGCLVVAKYMPKDSQVFLLAPPIEAPYERFIKTPGWSRRGSVLKLNGESRLIRSDGSQTLVEPAFWTDFQTITDTTHLYISLVAKNKVRIIFAGEDNVLGKETPPKSLDTEVIDGADHDFSGSAREVLIDRLLKQIEL